MSGIVDSFFEMREAARRALALNRTRNTTRNYLNRYRDMLNDFRRDRLDRFIPDEMKNIQSLLDNADQHLENDPFSARDISRQIQNSIHGMRRLARENQLQQDQADREFNSEQVLAREAGVSAGMKAYYELVRTISGAATQNFARNGLVEIRKMIESGNLSDVSEIRSKVSQVKASAEIKAAEWKKQVAESVRKESLLDQIAETKARIESENFDNAEKQKVFQSLDNLLGRSRDASNVSEIQEALTKIENSADEEIISEDTRKEAVKSIIKIIRSQGFELSSSDVTIEEKNGESVVRIVGRKANGKHTEFLVSDKGKIRYCFDNYEGKACLKDMQTFKTDLEKIYSIKLKDEKVVWENPDLMGKDAFDLPNSNSGWRNG